MPYFEDASLRVIFRVGFRTGFTEENDFVWRHTGDVRLMRWLTEAGLSSQDVQMQGRMKNDKMIMVINRSGAKEDA